MEDDDASELAGDGSGPEPAVVHVLDLGRGDEVVVLQNGRVSAMVSPRLGGRLLLVAQPDEPLPPVLPPPALLDVGHEEDRWEVVITRPNAGGVEAVLGHVRGGSALLGSLKIYRLDHSSQHVEVDYRLAPLDGPFTVGTFLPPDVWIHIPEGEPLAWEATATAQPLRATSAERSFSVQVGIGEPPSRAVTIDLRGETVPDATVTESRSPGAVGGSGGDAGGR